MTLGVRARRLALLPVVACAAALPACGGGDDDGDKSESKPKTATASGGAPDPRAAIQQYFTAKRLGKASEGCALETEAYQVLQYEAAGQPCLDDPANKMPQPVWAVKTKVVSLDVTGDSASGVIEPNAGTPGRAQITLVRGDGGWQVDTLR